MKKLIKICIVNIVLLILILLFFEFGCAFFSFNHEKTKKYTFAEKIKRTIKYSKIHYRSPVNQNYKERVRPININNEENILLLGCSYTYGDGLDYDETFGAVLSKYTNKNVINLGMCCASPREMLFILRDDKTRNNLLPNLKYVKYVIYTYITDQKRRLYTDVCQFKYTPSFKADNKFTQLKHYQKNRLSALSFANNCINAFYYDKFEKKSKQSQNLLFLFFKEINNEIKKHYNDTTGAAPRFILLVYDDYDNLDFEQLKEQGITVINANELVNTDLSDKKYKNSSWHPNALAWELIVPALIKQKVII